jgi:hypothetical protein
LLNFINIYFYYKIKKKKSTKTIKLLNSSWSSWSNQKWPKLIKSDIILILKKNYLNFLKSYDRHLYDHLSWVYFRSTEIQTGQKNKNQVSR